MRNRKNIQSKRRVVLGEAINLCVYCFCRADVVDHIMPWSYSEDDSKENLVASCRLCNAIAHNKVFNSFEDKAAYIRRVRLETIRGPIAIWTMDELSEIGYSLRSAILAKAIVADNDREAKAIGKHLNKVGYSYIIYKGRVVKPKPTKAMELIKAIDAMREKLRSI